jgi:hypothetical protein
MSQVRFIEKIGAALEAAKFSGCLHRAHHIHQVNGIRRLHSRQTVAQNVPIGGTDEVGLEADFRFGQSHRRDDLGKPLDGRLGIALIHVKMLDE